MMFQSTCLGGDFSKFQNEKSPVNCADFVCRTLRFFYKIKGLLPQCVAASRVLPISN